MSAFGYSVKCSVMMVSFAILGYSTCASGFTFYFSDGSTQSVGTNYDMTGIFYFQQISAKTKIVFSFLFSYRR